MAKVVLTHTMRTRMFTCERKAFLAGLCGFRSTEKKAALRIGTNFDRLSGGTVTSREILGEYERLEAQALTIEEADALGVECNMVLALGRLYHEVFPDSDKEESNLKFRHPIRSVSGRPHPRIEAGGEIDGIMGNLLIERKTTGLTIEQRGRFLGNDNQLSAYIYGTINGLKRGVGAVSYRIARKPRLRQKKNESSDAFSARMVNDIWDRKEEYMGEKRIVVTSEQGVHFKTHLWEAARRFNDMLMRSRGLFGMPAPLSDSGSDLLNSYREMAAEAVDPTLRGDHPSGHPATYSRETQRLVDVSRMYPCNTHACGDFGGCEFFGFCSSMRQEDVAEALGSFSQSSHLNPELNNAG